jgi:SAM-dependent methyltransferase
MRASAAAGAGTRPRGGHGDAWDTHWDEFGSANERNPAQDYRRRLTLALVGRRGQPERLLDIGSGNGEFLAAAHARWPAAQLLGLELSESAVAQARRKVPAAEFRGRDLLRDRPPDGDDRQWATHATCSEVLEHVDDAVAFLRNARPWFAPGCRVVITVPGGPMSAFDHHIGHRQHFAQDNLREVIEAAGLRVLQVLGAGFPFFNVYRGLVVLRGEHLADDARADAGHTIRGGVVRLGMAAFRPLFFLNLPRSRFGWQTIGVAQEPLEGAMLEG